MGEHSATLFRGGRIIDPANKRDDVGDLLVVDGRIAAAGGNPPAGAREIDASGCWIVPGLIDMHVHLREPGHEYKETIASGCRAAAAGGFVAVACMPNTVPVNDCATVTAYILQQAAATGVHVYPVAAISKGSNGKELAEYGELRRAGAVAVSDDGLPVMNSQLMRRALEYASNHDLLVISHAEEASLAHGGVMNEGALSTRLGLRGIPRVAEEIMIYRDIALSEYSGQRLHIAHVSTAGAVDLIRQAKRRGCRVTAETAPHYFSLTEEAVAGYNTHAKMNPPLRTQADVEAIKAGLADGSLDAIATDHAPHGVLEKDVEFDNAANGIIGLETALPLTLELVRNGTISAARMVELLSVNPARILGVAGGSLATGRAADLTVIAPERRYVVEAETIRSKSRNTPFLGCTLTGRAVLTMVAGRVVHEESINL
ncbi:MAG: dihydroorotase [Thermodesulfobacteriota bacterium]